VTQDDLLYRFRLRAFAMAAELGNVRAACRAMGIHPRITAGSGSWTAMLRAEAGRDRYDRQLSDLIGELSTRSEAFRGRWAAHHVWIHTTGVKRNQRWIRRRQGLVGDP
jgi:hypothetical protein